ncbi:MAG: ATP-dependent Clp protease ATP-binding subunit [Candidatus Peribacteria bacterium]|nr:ATP-dependent Clp protease ATP-binding subunit [Candidatus Peribacteria bacterium]
MDQYYQEHFHEMIKEKTLANTGSVDIEQNFNEIMLTYKKDLHIEHIDFCFLFYLSFSHLSNESQVFQLFARDQIDPKSCMENCKNLLLNPLSRQQGVFAFLKILNTIFAQLHLDPNTITKMQININDNLENLEKFLDSVESEISLEAEQNGDTSSSTATATKKKEEKKLNIEYFGTDLTKESKDGFIDPIIGRDQEINQVIYTLLRKTKNNPLLIGEPGVGKTAIVEGLAQRIIAGTVPDKLKGKKIFLLDMGTIVAGTKYRGEFESRMKAILEEATDPTNNIILFIDELHTIIGAGGQEHNDAAQMLKPLLSRGKIKLIGATTFDEYQKVIEKDAALKRRFQEVVVNEPDGATTEQIIQGLRQTYEDFHGVQILDEAITAAISLSKRYILNKQLPDKALDILDEACARESTMQEKLESDDSYKKTEKKVEVIEKKIEKAITEQDYFLAAELKEQEEKLKKELHTIRNHKNIPTHLRSTIDAKDIGNVLAEKTGIPVNIVNEDEITKLRRLDETLKESLIGQDEAVDAVVRTLTRSRLSMISKKKPIGSFLFLGPSGVGKTYLAKLIAKDYFGDENAMIRFDMSEFMEKYSVSKLIGSPAGYVGFDEGGGLTEAVRRKPYSVVLFDEIEKASPDVLNILLQLLDEGQLKDSKGRLIDFKSTIIVMTSNIGSEEFSKKQVNIGFSTGTEKEMDEKSFDQIKERITDQLKNYLTPELLNRIDHKVIFKPLSKGNLTNIFNHQLSAFLEVWKANESVKLPKFNKKQIEEIIEKIYDPQY